MIRVVLNGEKVTIPIAFDARIIGTSAKETINVASGTSIHFTAGAYDRVNLPHNLADYQITAIGNQLRLVDQDANIITLVVGGKSTVGFADGASSLDMVFPVDKTPRVTLGGAVVGNESLDHDTVDFDLSRTVSMVRYAMLDQEGEDQGNGPLHAFPLSALQFSIEGNEYRLKVSPEEMDSITQYAELVLLLKEKLNGLIADNPELAGLAIHLSSLTFNDPDGRTGYWIALTDTYAREFEGQNILLQDTAIFGDIYWKSVYHPPALTEDIGNAVLSIEAVHINPESPLAGEIFIVEVDLLETGGAWTENLTVSLAIEDHANETVYIEKDRLSEIKNDSVTVHFDGLELLEPGNYTLITTASADNADSFTSDKAFSIIVEMPDALTVSLNNIVAGKVGGEVVVEASIAHFGQSGTITATLRQGATILSETQPLQNNHPGEELLILTFEDTGIFNPGKVDLIIGVEEGGFFAEAACNFGLFQSDENYPWVWADSRHSPFNMIGQVVVQTEDLLDGWYGIGTGFLISPVHMMTNAHVLEMGWGGDLSGLDSVSFFLGRNGASLLEEQWDNHYRGESAYLQKDEWGSMWPDTDMAIITLDKDVEGLEGQGYFDWFWNTRDEEDRDLTDEYLTWAGYPGKDVDQGKNAVGNDIFFQWTAHGTLQDYLPGYDDYGGASGGLKLSQDMLAAPGASGSPVFRMDSEGMYQFVGTYTGTQNDHPVAANLDPVAFDWALSIVQADGYLLDMEFLDSSWDIAELGPFKDLSAGDFATTQFQDFGIAGPVTEGVQVHGIPEVGWDVFYSAA